ncbi:MAG: UDP-glucose 4-epimerase GalE [Acidobacteria bacterium]|nr:UDP-glucose 4-epimerase GalE [Acidobacteriota bacterium]
MNLLVTGGAGYIGSAVAAELLKAGHAVVVFDNLSKGRRAAVPAGAQLVVGDIESRSHLNQVFRSHRVEAVLHFAALVEASESMRIPEHYFRTNTAGTLTLLDSMREHGVGSLVFSSTAAVYGAPVRTPIEESDPLHPSNPYGESKLMGERMLEWFHAAHGLRYASLRYFNAAGAAGDLGEDHRPESHLIPLILKVALGKEPHVRVCGTDYPTHDGTCIRDYIHVLDLAAAHSLALNALKHRGRMVYNLGLERGFSVREVVDAARRVTGHAIPTLESPRRPGDPAVLVASSKKIRQELSWQPQFLDLQTIISSAWEWRRNHPDGYA